MKAQRPQRGNPRRLTYWQHVLPVRSIARFASQDGKVAVKDRRAKQEFRLSPSDKFFCAQRSWDQRAEAGFMKEIEDEFQALAEEIIAGRRLIDAQVSRIVTRFFALWCLRFHFRHNPMPDHPIVGIVPENLSKDQEEMLEHNWISFVGQNQNMPGRFATGIQIQTSIFKSEKDFQNAVWGVATAAKGEFVIPDTFGNLAIVPLTPRISLIWNSKNVELSDVGVANVNLLAVQSARDYYIARDFVMCPISKSVQRTTV